MYYFNLFDRESEILWRFIPLLVVVFAGCPGGFSKHRNSKINFAKMSHEQLKTFVESKNLLGQPENVVITELERNGFRFVERRSGVLVHKSAPTAKAENYGHQDYVRHCRSEKPGLGLVEKILCVTCILNDGAVKTMLYSEQYTGL